MLEFAEVEAGAELGQEALDELLDAAAAAGRDIFDPSHRATIGARVDQLDALLGNTQCSAAYVLAELRPARGIELMVPLNEAPNALRALLSAT